jgi:PKD repeat protein
MKTKRFRILAQTFFLGAAISLFTFSGCEKDEDTVKDPVASFQYEVSESNPLEVAFTNYSQDASTYAWDFGDGETSIEESPTHAFAAEGTFNVTLTAQALLTGTSSKKWMLVREGNVMGVGPEAPNFTEWWSLANDGARPCVFKQSWTFNTDGTFAFDDGGLMWGDNVVFAGTDNLEICFEAIAANMVNTDGVDVSAWLSGTHDFDYDAAAGTLKVSGTGAWMGLLSKTVTSGAITVPQESVTYGVTIIEGAECDSMFVSVEVPNADDGTDYWQFNYVSYHDWANQPDVVEEAAAWGEDLEDITPTEIKITFASKDAANLVTIDTIASGSGIKFGVDDPTNAGAAKVGEFTRTAGEQYQELKFQASPDAKDLQFTNFTTVKIDVFVPADTDFAGTALVKHMVFGFADVSQTQEWWNNVDQYVVENDDLVVDTWTTYTFDLSTTNVLTRTDLDMLYLGIGGGGHTEGGTFYVRNLIFE